MQTRNAMASSNKSMLDQGLQNVSAPTHSWDRPQSNINKSDTIFSKMMRFEDSAPLFIVGILCGATAMQIALLIFPFS